MDEQCSEITFNFWYTLQVGSAGCFTLCVTGISCRFSRGWVDWLGTCTTPFFGEAKIKKEIENCEYCGRNEGKHSVQMPHSGVTVFSCWFQFSNCNPLILQPQITSHPPS